MFTEKLNREKKKIKTKNNFWNLKLARDIFNVWIFEKELLVVFNLLAQFLKTMANCHDLWWNSRERSIPSKPYKFLTTNQWKLTTVSNSSQDSECKKLRMTRSSKIDEKRLLLQSLSIHAY